MTAMTLLRRTMLAVLGLLFLAGPALAEAPALPTPQPAPLLFNPDAKAPETKGIPLFDTITQGGGKLYYMGERSGLSGFLLVKNGQIQMLYMAPDRKSVLIGALFAETGDIVTPQQISRLSEKNKEIADIMNASGAQQGQIVRAGAVKDGAASVPGDQAAVAAPPASIPVMPISPGERLLQDMQAAANVVVGSKDAPELIMVISPTCAFCKRTWEELRDSVKAGKIKVRLVPITRDTGDEELHAAAQLLRVQEPLQAWDSYVGGNKDALAGTPDQLALRAVIANRDMTDRWNILGTPYLVYRAKDGTIKIVQGKPERMAAVLSDLIR